MKNNYICLKCSALIEKSTEIPVSNEGQVYP